MPAYDVILPAPMCSLGARFTGDTLTRLDFLPAGTTVFPPLPDARVRQLARELDAYWAHAAHLFDFPFSPRGTAFQLRVWHALTNIPPGQPTTYGALAKQLHSAPRAIGQACGANPLPIFIPCHRVVSASGLGGFMRAASGAPLEIKTWLLQHERRDHEGRSLPPPQP